MHLVQGLYIPFVLMVYFALFWYFKPQISFSLTKAESHATRVVSIVVVRITIRIHIAEVVSVVVVGRTEPPGGRSQYVIYNPNFFILVF